MRITKKCTVLQKASIFLEKLFKRPISGGAENMAVKIGINGFGRIGRCLFRLNYEVGAEKRFRIVAIKDVIPIENVAYLLKYDSHYGNFGESVEIDGNNLVVNGEKIPYFMERDVTKIPWKDLGVEILVESSGKVTGAVARSLVDSQIGAVVFSRNEDDADVTLVHGFDQGKFDPSRHKLISASSCTGTAIVPVIDIIDSHFRIMHGHLVTIHPVLSDQRLIDVSHEKFNLGRNAMMSIIPVSTGIAKSVSTALPQLKNKLTAISYRVPTTVVSVIDASFHLEKEAAADELNRLFREYSENRYKGIVGYDEGYVRHSKVSIDFLKSHYSAVLLGLETQSRGRNVSISIFHDNEWSYCCRVHDLISYISGRRKNG